MTFQNITAGSGAAAQVNENFDAVAAAGTYGKRAPATSGLTWGFYGGRGFGNTIADGTVALTASTTNYVVANRSTGAVSVSTAITNWNDTTNYYRLFLIVTGSSTVSSATDYREFVGGAAAGFTGGTLTSALNEAAAVTIASAATVNIGAAAANTINVTGTVTITAFDSIAASAIRRIVFSGALTLTHNATSLILPTGASITTAAGDVAEFVSLGSGNWRCINYLRATGSALAGSPFTGGTLTGALNEAPAVALASASTVNIGAAAANLVTVSGTTTITAFDSIAASAIRRVRFLGALTLTHNATSLILPGSANITTAAGDVATMESLGSGNWRCIDYAKADGTSVVGGGAGLTNWVEAVNTAAPNATVPVVSFTATNAATNVDAVLAPKGTGAIASRVADNTSANGNKRGINAVDWQTSRSIATAVASASWSAIGGGSSNTASGSNATVPGGSTNVASGTASFAVGDSNTASNTGCVAMGVSNTASTSTGAAAIGANSTASGYAAMALGRNAIANADFSIATGYFATVRGIIGAHVHASDRFAAQGDAQIGRYVLRRSTSDATPSSLSSAGAAPTSTTTMVLPDNSVYDFVAYVVARNGTTAGASYKIEGTIKRNSGVGTAALIGTPAVTSKGVDSGASTWVVAAVANTTLGSLDIQVTGAAATTIKWVARVETVEVVG